ncbi:unnamed protein product [Adineta ricciae]|uniref:Uncharacterized protein n=1 Tax=Adineta ricciae TaxID=249248 RepID=A0A816FAS9_ADIRI|nr:unnamed protein product [Adineta ricciae]CAF1659103.1 unnamed protein product [Adineta ricciae]
MSRMSSKLRDHNTWVLDSQQNPAISRTGATKQTVTKVPKKTYHRTVTLRIPLVEKKYFLKPAPIERQNGKSVVVERTTSTASQIATKAILGVAFAVAVSYLLRDTLNNRGFEWRLPRVTQSETCNMDLAKNRDFNRFYGLSNSGNHFTSLTNDACDSKIVVKSLFPPAVLKSDQPASSFIILSKFGTGKTSLRCEYLKSLSSADYFKLLILNQDLNKYLDRFVQFEISRKTECQGSNCLVNWSTDEFGQMILSLLVTQLVDEYEQEKFYLSDVLLDEKIELITILCYYYNGEDLKKLEMFVNYLLEKPSSEKYSASDVVLQYIQQNVYYEKPLFKHLKDELNKFTILSKIYEKLHLLIVVTEGEEFVNLVERRTMSGNVFTHFTWILEILNKLLRKSVVVIVDGIDESHYFLQKNTESRKALELFFRSSVSHKIQSLVLAQHFYLALFYPQINATNFQDAIVRSDKFPTHRIQWDTNALMNYADAVLQEMNENASTDRCREFTDFAALVNYHDPNITEIINHLQTPRELHQFVQKLIMEMNNSAKDNDMPFIATYENVRKAYSEAETLFNRDDKLTEA